MIVVRHPTLGVCLGAAVGRVGGSRAVRLVWSSECVVNALAGVASAQEFVDVAAATAFLTRGGVNYATSSCVAIAVREANISGRQTPLATCATVTGEGATRLATLVVER